MPTFEKLQIFLHDWSRLDPPERDQFMQAVEKFYDDLVAGQGFRKSLRVKGAQGHPGIFELTWGVGNGRATFEFGPSVRSGHVHIIWRRIGGHDIFQNP
ncbi:MAG: hypothetical protein ACRDHP_21120 [Ktedonobacterales bacterium]